MFFQYPHQQALCQSALHFNNPQAVSGQGILSSKQESSLQSTNSNKPFSSCILFTCSRRTQVHCSNYSFASSGFPSSSIASYVLSIINSIYLVIFLRAFFIDILWIHLVISQNITLPSSIFISTLLKGNRLSYPYASSKVLLKKTRSHKLE